MKLHFYIARRFTRSFLTILAAVMGIFMLLATVDHITMFDGGSVGFGDLLRLSLLQMPAWIYDMLPLLVILATLMLFLSLARTSEMVVTRAAGRSALITLIAPVLTIAAIGGLALAVVNPIAASTSKRYEILKGQLGGSESSVVSISREGLWLRQGSADGQVVIRALNAGPDGTELTGVTFFSFSPEGRPLARIEAASARLEPGRWALADAKIWSLTDTSNPEREAVLRKAYWITSNLTQDQIRDRLAKPSSIAIWDLPDFIAQLDAAGFSSRRHQVWLQMEIAMPLFLVSMVLIGAGFTMRHTRFGRTGLMVLLALGFGFGSYFIRDFAQILGENGQIPVVVAAWTPPVAAILMALGILLHLEDG
jgi:lipopolysaccharide export system permease protein